MRRPGEVLSRFQLLEHAWDYEYENRSNVVDAYVRFLREKIDRPFGVESIETVRGAGYRLREDGGRVSRLPIRLRVTLAFAAVMAVVLAGDRPLPLPAPRVAARRLDRPGPALARRRGLAPLVAGRRAASARPREQPLDRARARASPRSSPRRARSFDSTPQLRRPTGARPGRARGERRAAPIFVDRAGAARHRRRAGAPARDARSRSRGRRLIVVVGASLDDRDEALASLAHAAADRRAGRAAARLAGRLRAPSARRCGRSRRCAARAAEISAAGPDERLPVPPAARRDRRLGETLNEMLARLEAALERERALRRRRQPRAAHAAGAAQDRARAGAAPRRERRRSCAPRSPPPSRRPTG